MDYLDDVVTNKKYIQNIVILINGTYFAKRQPDSGLSIASPYDGMVVTMKVNPATIDIRKVNTTVSGCTFSLLDKDGIVSALVAGNAANLIGQDVTIWVGRSRRNSSFEANDFAGYLQLPITKIRKATHDDNTYEFTTSEDTDRIAKPIYSAKSALAVDILSGTTTITMRDPINDFPASGQVRVENEIFSYTTKNDSTKQFSGVIRGELGTTPAAHAANTNCFQTETVTGNALTIFLKLLVSGGGGGTYDVLKSGLGIDQNLIDISGVETLRDTLYSSDSDLDLEFSNIDSALKFIETEILQFFNLRLTYSDDAKLTLVVLDKAIFSPIVDSITEDSIVGYPKWSVDDTKIVNRIKISWDYDEPTNVFRRYEEFTDAASIAAYGARNPLTFSFRGVKTALGGDDQVADFVRVLFARLSTPVAEVQLKTHIDKSTKNIGAKVYIESTKIPSTDGGLTFAADMEQTKRAIDFERGEVSQTFSFTSFTKIRSLFIAPSDMVVGIESQKKIFVATGRKAKYQVGWYMRLWNETTQDYEADSPNKIVELFEAPNSLELEQGGGVLELEQGGELLLESTPKDAIVFENNWSTTLQTHHRIRFAKYNDVVNNQKRYGFLSDDGNNFADGKPTYKVTY